MFYRSLAVQWLAGGVYHPPDQAVANRHLGYPASGAHLIPLLHPGPLAEDHRSDAVLLQVQGDADNPVGELEKLVIPGAG